MAAAFITSFVVKFFGSTVTKANQDEALLWKVAVLGMEKPPVSAGTFCPLPMLAFYIPPSGQGSGIPRKVLLQCGRLQD